MGSFGNPMESVLLKVGNCQDKLSTWNRRVFNNVRILLVQKRKKLENAEALSMEGRGHERVKALNEKIDKLMDMKDYMWNQRAKTDWLKYGDQNTKYFHCRSSECNKRNFITSLENETREWVEEENQVGDMLISYYLGLFSSSNPVFFDLVIDGVESRISASMNDDLDKPFEAFEVQFALN